MEYEQEHEDTAHKLQVEWESLYLSAIYRGTTLESTKDRFCQMTMDEIAEFAEDLKKFIGDFEAHGPGSFGNDLDTGLMTMEVSTVSQQ